MNRASLMCALCLLAHAAVASSPFADQRIVNISTRGQVLTGDDVLIGGFIIAGSEPKTVMLRARGPSLADAGVPGVLTDPNLTVYSGPNQVDFNDDWGDHSRSGDIPPDLAPSNPAEAAIMITLAPGPYTAIVRGTGGATATKAEAHDANETSDLIAASCSLRQRCGIEK